jgi:hypothetical protein
VNDDCIRCGDAPATYEDGYCRNCHWVVLTEIEYGMRKLRTYLARWSDFRDWELSQPD